MYELSFIKNNMDELKKSEVKVAEYILEHPNKVVFSSIGELAELVGVSEPTVLRFSRRIGFKGFQDFKIYLAQSVVPAVQNIHEAIDGNEKIPDLVSKVFDTNINAIKNTLSTLDYSALEKIIERFSSCSKVIFFGLGGSGVIAMDGYHKFFRIGIPCEYFVDYHMAVMSASMMSEGQIFIAISHSGSSKAVIKAIETAKKAGAYTAAIVSHEKSLVSHNADATLCVASYESNYRFEPMSSMIAQMCLIDILSVSTSLENQSRTIENLNKARQAMSSERF